MQRLLLSQLLKWQTQAARKPILLDGARQTGKSYLLKELFGRRHFAQCHVIDFLKQPDAAQLFDQDLDPVRIINDLGFFLKRNINPETDLVIFDEIGECHKAVQSLKYFAEDQPSWFICTTGSNIGLLNGFPVGKVHGLRLRPMNFEEFLRATANKQQLAAFDRQDRRALVHKQLWPLPQLWSSGGEDLHTVLPWLMPPPRLISALKLAGAPSLALRISWLAG